MHTSAPLVQAIWASEDNIPGPPKGAELQSLGFHNAVLAQCVHKSMQLTMPLRPPMIRLIDSCDLSLGTELLTIMPKVQVADDARMVTTGHGSCGHMWRAMSRPQRCHPEHCKPCSHHLTPSLASIHIFPESIEIAS